LDAVSYCIYRSQPGHKPVKLKTLDASSFQYDDTSVVRGKTFIYSATALDSAKNESGFTVADTVFVHDNTPPPQVNYLKALATQKGVRLEWDPVYDFDFAGYNVYRCTVPTGLYEKINSKPIVVQYFEDSNGSKVFYYKVVSVDTSGNESPTDLYAQVE